eukprot:4173900-Lingulodinium_polyedra.AAC.1
MQRGKRCAIVLLSRYLRVCGRQQVVRARSPRRQFVAGRKRANAGLLCGVSGIALCGARVQRA